MGLRLQLGAHRPGQAPHSSAQPCSGQQTWQQSSQSWPAAAGFGSSSSRRKRAIGCALLPHFRVWPGLVRLATLAASPLSDSVLTLDSGQRLRGAVLASGRYLGESTGVVLGATVRTFYFGWLRRQPTTSTYLESWPEQDHRFKWTKHALSTP